MAASPSASQSGSPQPSQNSWAREHAGALITAGGSIIVAAIGAAALLATQGGDGPKDPEVTVSKAEPRDGGVTVTASDGYVAEGVVGTLSAGDSIWLMDKDPYGYAIAEQASISDGEWTAESHPIGDEDVKVPFTIEAAAIWADTDCANALRGYINRGDWYIESLPRGCREVATRKVSVTEK
jgi:hypothetical protein